MKTYASFERAQKEKDACLFLVQQMIRSLVTFIYEDRVTNCELVREKDCVYLSVTYHDEYIGADQTVTTFFSTKESTSHRIILSILRNRKEYIDEQLKKISSVKECLNSAFSDAAS